MFFSMSASTRQRILNVMGTFRPAFRSVAQSLTDIDLILVEEAFERLLLDYDRVFSSMGIPACLWRRTGEIYKGNKEFATLLNIPFEDLREVIYFFHDVRKDTDFITEGSLVYIRINGRRISCQLLGEIWKHCI